MKRLIKHILIGALPLLSAACSSVDVDQVNNENDLPNAIYMEGVQSSPMKKVLVEGNGAEVDFSARAANLVKKDIRVSFSVDTTVLNRYNAEYGKNFKLLPEDCYEIEKVESVIKAGDYCTEPILVNINEKASTVNPSFKYAIPIKVSANDGTKVLQNNSFQIIALDRILETSAMRQAGFYMRCDLAEPGAPMVLKEWTLHYGMRVDSWFDNQQPVMGSFYSRITRDGKLQYKAGGSDDPAGFSIQRITPNKWFHVTFTYKNQHVKMYLNGVLEREFDVTNNDNWFKIQASFGNFRGYLRDIRLYNKALTNAQIVDNLYVEDPTNPMLITYVPLTKETGIKDVSGHGRDFKAFTTGSNTDYDLSQIQWLSPLYFPEK